MSRNNTVNGTIVQRMLVTLFTSVLVIAVCTVQSTFGQNWPGI